MTQRQYRRRFNKHRAYDLQLLTVYRRVWRKIELNSSFGKLGSRFIYGERPSWGIACCPPCPGFLTSGKFKS